MDRSRVTSWRGPSTTESLVLACSSCDWDRRADLIIGPRRPYGGRVCAGCARFDGEHEPATVATYLFMDRVGPCALEMSDMSRRLAVAE